ncbi:hypothetical protein GCM10020000_10820 [Streptomyces olivoverticillatus]
MQISHAAVPAASTRPRWAGTSAARCGTKKAVEVTKVSTMLPGGPTRAASHSILWAAATSDASSTSTTAEETSAAAVSAAPTPATVPSTTQATVRARAAYGRSCP